MTDVERLSPDMKAMIEASTDPAWLAGQLGFARAARLRTTPVPEPEKAAPRPAKSPETRAKISASSVRAWESPTRRQKYMEQLRKAGRGLSSVAVSHSILDPDFDEV